MARITAFMNLSLDGVYQAPGKADEDPRSGFTHGGWAAPYQAMTEAGDLLGNPGELLFGRWTYELFYDSWGQQGGKQGGNPFSDFFNSTRKYVVSRNPDFVPVWQNSALVTGDTVLKLQELKASNPKDLLIFGSGELIKSLAESNLIDRYILLIHPLLLGSGKALGSGLVSPQQLVLETVRPTQKGVLIASYVKAEKPVI